jgi:hypothetical protein
MNLAVMGPAQRRDEFIADLAAQRTRLHEAQVMGIRWRSPTHQARLLRDEPQMLLIAIATRLCDGEDALVHNARPGQRSAIARVFPSPPP